MAQEVEILFAVTSGLLDDVAVDKVRAFEAAFHSYLASNHPEITDAITTSR